MLFRQLFDRETCTYTYLLADPATRQAVLIDPVLELVERDVQLLRELDLELVHTLETHVHADHVTGGAALRDRLGSTVVVGQASGTACADVPAAHGDVVQVGSLKIEVRATPGHTASCVTYVVHDAGMAFTGDAIMVRGCGRTDFQSGSAETLYDSVHGQILSLPPETKLYPGHDYKGRTVTTVAEEHRFNPRLGGGRSQEEFVAIMDNLDLAHPKRIDEAVPANLCCGQWAPYTRRSDGVAEVQVDWVAQSGVAHRVVDVRSAEEFKGELGHIKGAQLVPLDQVQAVTSFWERSQPLVTVCRSGGRSAAAAATLQDLGFAKVVSMAGGMMAWNNAGLPVAGT
jgi:sulfur dioxygenase